MQTRMRHEMWPAPEPDVFVVTVVLFCIALVAIMGAAVLLLMAG